MAAWAVRGATPFLLRPSPAEAGYGPRRHVGAGETNGTGPVCSADWARASVGVVLQGDQLDAALVAQLPQARGEDRVEVGDAVVLRPRRSR